MRRAIVPWIVETSRIRRRLIHQAQDRNHSSAYTYDYAFFAHGHLLGPLDVRASEMFSDASNGNHAVTAMKTCQKCRLVTEGSINPRRRWRRDYHHFT